MLPISDYGAEAAEEERRGRNYILRKLSLEEMKLKEMGRLRIYSREQHGVNRILMYLSNHFHT